ncbi:MAG: pirin family protein [Deltaproteobacteria bacterium]|nr:pirin family protein [Deltaproteobacteria bacterium]
MIRLRAAEDRGKYQGGGLTSYHSFSFGEYYDEDFMGFRSLRVINDDIIEGGVGFPPHPHRDMEIVTYVTEGTLEHQDSMGNKEALRPGEIQRMTAGKGVTHSEYNKSKEETLRLLQIWIVPEQRGLPPGYEQRSIGAPAEGFKKLAARSDPDSIVHIHQDATLYEGTFKQGATAELPLPKSRYGYLHVVSGGVKVGDLTAKPGDAFMIANEERPQLASLADSKVLFFDLA